VDAVNPKTPEVSRQPPMDGFNSGTLQTLLHWRKTLDLKSPNQVFFIQLLLHFEVESMKK